MGIWQKSDLYINEDVVLPDSLFEMPKTAKQRMEYCRYVGETENGILIEIKYMPSFDAISQPVQRRFISFPQIYTGEIKILRNDNTMVKAERKQTI